MKKLFALALIAVLALTAAACGSDLDLSGLEAATEDAAIAYDTLAQVAVATGYDQLPEYVETLNGFAGIVETYRAAIKDNIYETQEEVDADTAYLTDVFIPGCQQMQADFEAAPQI